MKQLTNYKSDDIMILFKLTERELCRANGMSDGTSCVSRDGRHAADSICGGTAILIIS